MTESDEWRDRAAFIAGYHASVRKSSPPKKRKLVLKELDQITRKSRRVEYLTGIYFLISNGKVVYVGQTTNVVARVSNHVPVKKFDRWAYVTCDPDQLNEWERAYIEKFDPIYNRDWTTLAMKKQRAVTPEIGPGNDSAMSDQPIEKTGAAGED